MTALAPGRQKRNNFRRVAFFAWAGTLSLVFGLLFVGVTALTIGLWFANQNHDTTPVADLGFFALGAILITTGLVVQLRAAERHIAGLQQAVIGLLALAAAGLIGDRVEPFAGGVIFLVATAPLVALHPARGAFFAVGRRRSDVLGALALLAALPAGAYAATMLVQARQAGPSCFFGQCAYGDRFAELAALGIATVATALLAASKPAGWRINAWCVGAAAAMAGGASVVWAHLPGSLSQTGGTLTVLWGALFVAVAEREWHRDALASRRETSQGAEAVAKGGAKK